MPLRLIININKTPILKQYNQGVKSGILTIINLTTSILSEHRSKSSETNTNLMSINSTLNKSISVQVSEDQSFNKVTSYIIHTQNTMNLITK